MYSAALIEITNAYQQVSYLKTHEKYSSTPFVDKPYAVLIVTANANVQQHCNFNRHKQMHK